MSNQNKKVDKSGEDIVQACQEVLQKIAAPTMTIKVMENLAYNWETQRLREILCREPNIYDRLQYRVYLEFSRLVRQGRPAWGDEAKIFEAAWEDAGKSEAIWW